MAKKKSIEKIASLICGRGRCFCGYDCGHPNKFAPLPLIGTGTVCPLEKFNCQVDKRSPFEIPAGDNLTIDDCWTFCAQCEHAEVQADGSVFLKDFESHCLDCPVKAAFDGLTESAAGAFC